MKKRVALLGSTGVVGKAALELMGEDYEVVGLAAKTNARELLEQAHRFPKATLALFEGAATLQKELPGRRVLEGEEGLLEIATLPEVDLVIVALSASVGLLPAARALQAMKEVAIASKEVLVAGGKALQKLSQKPIIPIDSELLGVRDCLHGREAKEVHRITLPASGGPFWRRSLSDLEDVTPEEATLHPTCTVGRKPAVDSALLLNKGFELIATHLLFEVPASCMEVMIHPQSLLQCGVTFQNGVSLASFMPPSIYHALQRALGLPTYLLPFPRVGLEFFPIEEGQFPCLALALEALRLGGTALPVLVSASEVLIDRFLQGEIRYTAIAPKLEKLLMNHRVQADPTLPEIISLAAATKSEARYP